MLTRLEQENAELRETAKNLLLGWRAEVAKNLLLGWRAEVAKNGASATLPASPKQE